MKPLFAALAVSALLAAPVAMAQSSSQPDTEGGRYLLRQVDGEYLRVDRETGDTSICRKGDAGWTCALVADDRQAYENEISRLSDENADLARQVAELGEQVAALRSGTAGELEGGPAPEGEKTEEKAEEKTSDNEIILQLPSDEDLDELSQTFETVMRRFVEMLRSLKSDIEQKNAN